MIVKGRKNKQYLLFGIMAVVLGGGDSFHLIPRVISLISGNEEAFLVPLGVGKAITSHNDWILYSSLLCLSNQI